LVARFVSSLSGWVFNRFSHLSVKRFRARSDARQATIHPSKPAPQGNNPDREEDYHENQKRFRLSFGHALKTK
jgi:hypothetical protein